MDNDTLIKIGSTLAGICGSVGAWLKWFLPWWREQKRAKPVVEGLKTLHKVYSAMERASNFGAERVIIFAGHDSGGHPRVGSPFFTTAVHWHTDTDHTAAISEYQDLQADSAYVDMLIRMEREGFYRVDFTSEKDKGLKRLYESEGVVDAIKFYLTCSDNSFLYLSCASYTRKFTNIELTRLQLVADTIRNAIKNQ